MSKQEQSFVTASAIKMVASINNHATAQNATLRVLGHKGVKDVYSNKNSDLLMYVINNVKLNLRKPFASWLRKLGILVDEVEAKVAGKYGTYIVQALPRNPKKQDEVIEAIKANTTGDVLADAGKTYVERAKKVYEDDQIENEKRARAAVADTIKRLKAKDAKAGDVLNDMWSRKTAEEYCFIAGDGKVLKLSEEESNYLYSVIQELRKGK